MENITKSICEYQLLITIVRKLFIFCLYRRKKMRKMHGFFNRAVCITGPIFLRRFKLYMFSFTFGFMFANIYFEKYQNSKIYVMFIINIT